ncbi:hypothetical protein [Listeria sp. ILCC797]|uniref:hypothetical protein n=1 Tax=Listeria sp. ILCC797 TaxID=1918333 RepID=UPI000B596AE5|nr:hypothetical protein [Listeria sp. ILCC797]
MSYLVLIFMVAAIFIFVNSIVKGKVISYYPLVEKLLLFAALCLIFEVAVNGITFRLGLAMVCIIIVLITCCVSKVSKEK